MKANIVLVLLIGLFIFSSCQQDRSGDPGFDPETEEYVIYNLMLANKFSSGNVEMVLIMDHTNANSPGLIDQDIEGLQENTPLEPEMAAIFKERNQQPSPVKPNLNFGLEYVLLSQEEVDALHMEDEASGWELLQETYPKSYGFLSLSRVAFNQDYTQALVYYSVYHYDQPIEGGYSLYVCENDGWEYLGGMEWTT